MEERTFDLTVPVTRGFLMIQAALGLIFTVMGVLNLENNTVLGGVQLVGGLLIVTSVGLVQRMDKHIIAFKDARLEIEKGLFRNHDIPWTSIEEIHLVARKAEFLLGNGKRVEINFGRMSYSDNQIIKPQIIEAVTAFAEAKGIPVQDGRGA